MKRYGKRNGLLKWDLQLKDCDLRTAITWHSRYSTIPLFFQFGPQIIIWALAELQKDK